ncbi:MAG: response regulator, partial [Cytophagales bacterium]
MNIPTKLLLVDDAPTILTLLSNLFGKNHEVFKSSTLKEAREILNNSEIDLVICDLNMPEGKGQDLVT